MRRWEVKRELPLQLFLRPAVSHNQKIFLLELDEEVGLLQLRKIEVKKHISSVQNVVSNGFWLFGCLMVFNATFNNISVISWQSTFLVEETGETFIYCRDEFSNYIVFNWFWLFSLEYFSMKVGPFEKEVEDGFSYLCPPNHRRSWHGPPPFF